MLVLAEYNTIHLRDVYLGIEYARVKGENGNRSRENEKSQLDVSCRETL